MHFVHPGIMVWAWAYARLLHLHFSFLDHKCTWIMIYTKAQLDIKNIKYCFCYKAMASGHVINVLNMNWLFYHSFHSKEPWFSLSLSVFSWKTLSLLLCPPNSGWWRLSREFSTDVPITFRPNGLQIYFDRSTTSLLFIFIGGKIKASLNGEIWMSKVLQNVWGKSGGWIIKKLESEVEKSQRLLCRSSSRKFNVSIPYRPRFWALGFQCLATGGLGISIRIPWKSCVENVPIFSFGSLLPCL